MNLVYRAFLSLHFFIAPWVVIYLNIPLSSRAVFSYDTYVFHALFLNLVGIYLYGIKWPEFDSVITFGNKDKAMFVVFSAVLVLLFRDYLKSGLAYLIVDAVYTAVFIGVLSRVNGKFRALLFLLLFGFVYAIYIDRGSRFFMIFPLIFVLPKLHFRKLLLGAPVLCLFLIVYKLNKSDVQVNVDSILLGTYLILGDVSRFNVIPLLIESDVPRLFGYSYISGLSTILPLDFIQKFSYASVEYIVDSEFGDNYYQRFSPTSARVSGFIGEWIMNFGWNFAVIIPVILLRIFARFLSSRFVQRGMYFVSVLSMLIVVDFILSDFRIFAWHTLKYLFIFFTLKFLYNDTIFYRE